MNLKKLKLAPKLTSYFLILGLVPLIVVGLLAYNKAKAGLYNEAVEKLVAVREIKKEQISEYFTAMDHEFEFIIGSEDIHHLYDELLEFHIEQKVGATDKYPVNHPDYKRIWEKYGEFPRRAQESFEYYDVFMICAKHGHVMYTNEKHNDMGENLSSGSLKNSGLGKLWKEIVSTKEMAMVDYSPYAPRNGEPVAFWGEPIFAEDGTLEGVLALEMPLEHINEIMQQKDGLGETGEAYMVGSDLLMRSDSRHETVNHTVVGSFANPSEGSVKTKATERAFKGDFGTDVIQNFDDEKVLSAYTTVAPFDGIEWAVIVEIDEAEAMAPVKSLLIAIVITMIIAAVVIIFIALIIANGIAKPVSAMADVAGKIAEGDLTQTITVDTEDEVGILGNALIKMTENLRGIVGNIKGTTETVASASEELSAVSNQMLAGSEEMVTQATSVASSTEQMSTNINTMASAAEEMSVNANEVAGAAEQTSQNMNAVSSAVEEMSVSIGQIAQDAGAALEVAEQATESSQKATTTMGTLSEAAKEIGNVTEVIKRIAEQTNLLALNATIEAASAGEAGKGFAVVANEIKELANQSAKAADDIATRIDGVQTNTDEAVTVIGGVSEVIAKIGDTVKNIAQAVEQQNGAVSDISANVVQAGSGVENIAASIAEVAKGANDVSRNSGEASKGAIEVTSNITGIQGAAQETNGGAGQVNNSAVELSKMAGELKEIVGQFTI